MTSVTKMHGTMNIKFEKGYLEAVLCLTPPPRPQKNVNVMVLALLTNQVFMIFTFKYEFLRRIRDKPVQRPENKIEKIDTCQTLRRGTWISY